MSKPSHDPKFYNEDGYIRQNTIVKITADEAFPTVGKSMKDIYGTVKGIYPGTDTIENGYLVHLGVGFLPNGYTCVLIGERHLEIA